MSLMENPLSKSENCIAIWKKNVEDDSGLGSSRPSTSSNYSKDDIQLNVLPKTRSEGTTILMIPLYRAVLYPSNKAFFITNEKVLAILDETREVEDMLFIYYTPKADTKSKLPQTMKDAANSVICSRLPFVKTWQVQSLESILSFIEEKADKEIIEKFLYDTSSLNESDMETQYNHTIKKLTGIQRLKHVDTVRKLTGIDRHKRKLTSTTSKRLTAIQMNALLGIPHSDSSLPEQKFAEGSDPQRHRSEEDMERRNTSVHEAISNHPNANLVALSPAEISIIYNHESFLQNFILNISNEDTISRLCQIKDMSDSMRNVLHDSILQKAKRHYESDAIQVATYCSSGKKLLYGYDPSVTTVVKKKYCGLDVEIRNPKLVESTCDLGEKRFVTSVGPKLLLNVNKCIQDNSYTLWNNHSNLNAIMADIHGREEFDFRIILVCSGKGILLHNDLLFPKELEIKGKTKKIPVKVIEGYFSFGTRYGNPQGYNDPLCIGCTIGAEGRDVTGSLGLFIEHDKKFGFLTCTHVLYDCLSNKDFKPDPVKVLQPGADDLHCTRTDDEKYIGEVVEKKVVFSSIPLFQETSVDAAMVAMEKRIPKEAVFAVRDRQQLIKSGFTKDGTPKLSSVYRTGKLTEKDHGQRVFKFGGSTGLTSGYINIGNAEVRIEDVYVRFLGNSSSPVTIMKKQLEIRDIEDVFFLPGDSGSAVFRQDENGDLYPIGLAIGYAVLGANKRSTVVTPIDAILNALGLTWKSIKTF